MSPLCGHSPLQWHHNGRDGISNHQLHDCLLNRLFNQGVDQRKLQSSTSLAFMRGIHRWPVNSMHKGPVTRKMCPFDDIIMSVIVAWHPISIRSFDFNIHLTHYSPVISYGIMDHSFWSTVMSLLEALPLIEAPPRWVCTLSRISSAPTK